LIEGQGVGTADAEAGRKSRVLLPAWEKESRKLVELKPSGCMYKINPL